MKLNSGDKNEQGRNKSKCGENIVSLVQKLLCYQGLSSLVTKPLFYEAKL
jgi:hypothetical protein